MTQIGKSGQRILIRGRITGWRIFFTGGVNVTSASQSAAMQSAAAVALMPLLIFCCVHRSSNLQYFSTMRTISKICLFPLRDLDPHLIHDFFWPTESPTQTASASVQPLYGAHVMISRQTDKQTDRPRYFVCSNRQLLLLCSLIILNET